MMTSSTAVFYYSSFIFGVCTLVFGAAWIMGLKSKTKDLESEAFTYFLFSTALFGISVTLYLYISGRLEALIR